MSNLPPNFSWPHQDSQKYSHSQEDTSLFRGNHTGQHAPMLPNSSNTGTLLPTPQNGLYGLNANHQRELPAPSYGHNGRFSLSSVQLPSFASSGFGSYPPVRPPAPIVDPTTIPLPRDKDNDSLPPHMRLEQVARPSPKVAGARRPMSDKAKGKQRLVEHGQPTASGSGTKRKATSALSAPEGKKRQGHSGRAIGAANYSSEDLDGLFDILEELLPLGGNAWNSAADEFNEWAEENGRPARTAKSLELKFKQLVKTTKPTGDAECPPPVLRAHQIDHLMNEKAGTRDLDDEDIIDTPDVLELEDSDSGEDKEKKRDADKLIKKAGINPTKKKPSTKPEQDENIYARRAPSDRIPRPSTRNPSLDVLTNISNALDPRARQARDQENTMAAMQATQIFQLSSQLRDTQRQLEGLRGQLLEAERRYNEAERRADRAELVGMMPPRAGPPSPRWPFVPRDPRDPPRPRYRQEVFYADGGRSTQWVGGSDDEDPAWYGQQDSPGTRRITFMDDPQHPTRQNHSATSGSRTRSNQRAGSPFRSAASPLNHTLPAPPSESVNHASTYASDAAGSEESQNTSRTAAGPTSQPEGTA